MSDFGVGGNVKFIIEDNFILVTTKITTVHQKIVFYLSAFNSSWYVERCWDINKYMAKSCPSWKSGKTSYSGIGQKLLERPVIHTHHIYMNEHIFFWMLRAKIIGICNVEMKIWGFTPSSGAFSKCLSQRKCWKPKIEIPVSQHLIITDIHNSSLDICFWGWQILWY